MDVVTVDERLAGTLRDVAELVEVRAPDGTVLGFFAALGQPHAARYAAAAAAAYPSKDLPSPPDQPRYTTDEVMKHLESLEKR